MSHPTQYIHLPPNTSPVALISERPFSVVVVINADVTSEWRHEVSEWLVNEGCLCMMAWGTDCSLWDDSVDIANLEAFDWGDIPKSHSISTTWYDGESLGEVFWYAKMSIFDPPDTSLDHLVILDVSDMARESELMELFAKSSEENEIKPIKSKDDLDSVIFEKGLIAIIYLSAFFIGINDSTVVQVVSITALIVLFCYSLWRKFVFQAIYTGMGVFALPIVLYI